MNEDSSFSVETPSGKGTRGENFPVASFLIRADLRRHVKVFYDFARAIDDIADNPELASADKIARLEGFAAAVQGENDDPAYAKGIAMNASLYQTGITARHCLDLVSAFKQDAVKKRYANWAELIDYCNRSAAPVGRYLLDLHGENPKIYPLSDGLCNALQIINHLQDCAEDYQTLDRVYLPQDILTRHRAEITMLESSKAPEELRKALLEIAFKTADILAASHDFPVEIQSRRLAMEAGVIWTIARRLADKLQKQDPLAKRIKLNGFDMLICAVQGVFRGLSGV